MCIRDRSWMMGSATSEIEFHALRGMDAGVKVAEVPGIGQVAVCNGIASAQRLLSDEEWRDRFVAIEVMACVGGCLGGGGEPKSDVPDILERRAAGIASIDEKAVIRYSHQNATVQKLYDQHLDRPLSHTAERLLHTTYAARRSPRAALSNLLDAVDRRDGQRAAALFTPDAVWDTGSEFGILKGREAIQEFVSTALPGPKGGAHFQRHRFVSPASGTVVLSPRDECRRFRVELDNGEVDDSGGSEESKGTTLSRRPVNVSRIPMIESLSSVVVPPSKSE
eukprot:TRINITY_DN28009_c0_g1_i1.p1 TRINITY_DN28009_c0_g1~~TRINITY_DN28009_c0_g1_i1.p1  ORF type:complete len:293 (+),score=59.05 TRINITY_DN28009_c0_g1_i1:40-879(+)